MKHIFEQKVYYSDTDAYGVVWHGSYLRWLEMGRVGLCEQLGHNLTDLIKQNIILPVSSLSIKYKASAKLEDELIIETEVKSFRGCSVTFGQVIKSKKTLKTFIEAEVVIVAINNEGKLYRRIPEVLANTFNEVLKCPQLV